jgi:hypothetical protein
MCSAEFEVKVLAALGRALDGVCKQARHGGMYEAWTRQVRGLIEDIFETSIPSQQKAWVAFGSSLPTVWKMILLLPQVWSAGKC